LWTLPALARRKRWLGLLLLANPGVIPAKPITIASELFSIQQRLYRLANATSVSTFPHISPVPENVGYPRYGHLGFSNISFNLADFSNCPTYKLNPSFKS
jgi:hypothetical protein